MTPLVIPTAVSALACLVLVAAEYKHWRVVRAIAKPIASFAFIAVAVMTLTSCVPHASSWSEYQLWVIVGLVLGTAGDIALLGKSQGAFLVGLVAFLFGHIAYVVAFAQLAAPSTWLDVRAVIPLAIGGTALRLLWPRLGDMRVPVIAYVLTIVTMVTAAIAAARHAVLPEQNRMLLLAGAALFFVSDLAVARDKFVGASFINRAWGLPAYYAGQLLIAWSLWPSFC
ncbi:MAG TPA: lysoplasmalogenase [Kofleriaceae bacterium]|nr:lysoplasmalogenase [Kofleriaceae bacterium]